MAVTILGRALNRGQIIWTDDFSHNEDDKGVVTATHSFFCHYDQVLMLTPLKGAACVQPGWNVLQRTTVSSSLEKAGISKVTCTYKAYVGPDGDFSFDDAGDDGKSYELGITLSDEPIETNYRYKDVSDAEKKTIVKVKNGQLVALVDEDYTYVDPSLGTDQIHETITSERGKELVDLILTGTETYEAPAQIWRATYRSKNKPSSTILNKVGKITSAKGAPGVSEDRKWLFIGCNVTEIGGIYHISLEWKLGRFNEDLY
jgi:hypothetical protein